MKRYLVEGLNAAPGFPLLPCPFCGSDNLYIGWSHAMGFGIQCTQCKARTGNFDLPEFSSKKNVNLRLLFRASMAWNARVPHTDASRQSITS